MSGRALKACLAICFTMYCPFVLNAFGGPTVTATGSTVGHATLNYEPTFRFEPEDKFYRQYFGKLDPQIEQKYLDQWQYHNMQLPYALACWGYEHFSFGNLDGTNFNPPESEVRSAFAHQVLRMRAQSAFKELVASASTSEGMKRARAAARVLDSLRESNISLFDGQIDRQQTTPVQFRLGYDIVTDASKLELTRGATALGVYHPQLMSSALGTAPRFALASMRLSTKWDPDYDRTAGLGYRWSDSVVEASYAQRLNEDVSGRLAGSQSVNSRAPLYSVYAELALRMDF